MAKVRFPKILKKDTNLSKIQAQFKLMGVTAEKVTIEFDTETELTLQWKKLPNKGMSTKNIEDMLKSKTTEKYTYNSGDLEIMLEIMDGEHKGLIISADDDYAYVFNGNNINNINKD